MGNCHSCLIHGSEKTNLKENQKIRSFADKFGLNQCQWCVQNARCHHKTDNYGTCGSFEDTPSQEIGWWGSNGVEIDSASQCTNLDRRPGLTFLKYLSPVNWNQPDEVTLVNATMVDFMTPSPTTKAEHNIHGNIVCRLYGFIRPPKKWIRSGEQWHMCASYSKAILRMNMANGDTNDLQVIGNLTVSNTRCQLINWTSVIEKQQTESANDTSTTERLLVDFQANRTLFTAGSHSNYYHIQSKIGLQHNGTHDSSAFTFEYLEPFSAYPRGDCSELTNCLQCLSDSMCGWCDATNKCMLRIENEQSNCVTTVTTSDNQTISDWKYFIVQPSQCANCSDYISCEQCVDSQLCEWWSEDARCARKGRSQNAVKSVEQCPIPCHKRNICSDCLNDDNRCVWCETTQQCFSFSVYTSEYQFGLCREWLDQTISVAETKDVPHQQQQCKSCESHQNCSTCLQSLGCGWCFDRDNPIEGICMQGDFNSSTYNCDDALHSINKKITYGETEYAYATCPDVDECGLGLHDCHKEAKCMSRRNYIFMYKV